MSVSAKRGHECVSNCVFKLLENTQEFHAFDIKLFYPFTKELKGYGGSHKLHMR